MVTFCHQKPPANQASSGQGQSLDQVATSAVTLHRVVTEPELVERSFRLETSIQNQVSRFNVPLLDFSISTVLVNLQNLPDFCESKIASATAKEDEQIWRFVRANFSDNPRLEFLDLLGFNQKEVAEKVRDGFFF